MRPTTRLLSVSLLVVLQPLLHGQREAPEPTQPNVLFLLIDDLGWPDVGCFGHEFHETPVIDSLARQGVRLSDFYAATPVCSSTRSTI